MTNRERRAGILTEQHGQCFYCHRDLTLQDAQLEHRIPLAAGGTDGRYNLVVSCESCNRTKGSAIWDVPVAWDAKLYGRLSTTQSPDAWYRDFLAWIRRRGETFEGTLQPLGAEWIVQQRPILEQKARIGR